MQEQYNRAKFPLILRKADLEAFIAKIKENESFVIENDNMICMPGGGNTIIDYDEGNFITFSCGQNWQDQQEEIRNEEDIKRYLWTNRKGINKITKALRKYFF